MDMSYHTLTDMGSIEFFTNFTAGRVAALGISYEAKD